MLWLSITLAVLISLAALAYAAWPLLRPQSTEIVLIDDSALVDLVRRKDTLLVSIKDLELDHQMGKLNDADFERLNARLRAQAVSLLRQIEQRTPQASSVEDELEAAILLQRRTSD